MTTKDERALLRQVLQAIDPWVEPMGHNPLLGSPSRKFISKVTTWSDRRALAPSLETDLLDRIPLRAPALATALLDQVTLVDFTPLGPHPLPPMERTPTHQPPGPPRPPRFLGAIKKWWAAAIRSR